MTHLILLSKEQLEQAEKNEFILVSEKLKTFVTGELVILQTDADEVHFRIADITRAVDGLLKNWCIISLSTI